MTDAIIPERSTMLPAEEKQQAEALKRDAELLDLAYHPGWVQIKQRLEAVVAKYNSPVFKPDMPYDEVGREYLMSKQVATILQEALDDVQAVVERAGER